MSLGDLSLLLPLDLLFQGGNHGCKVIHPSRLLHTRPGDLSHDSDSKNKHEHRCQEQKRQRFNEGDSSTGVGEQNDRLLTTRCFLVAPHWPWVWQSCKLVRHHFEYDVSLKLSRSCLQRSTHTCITPLTVIAVINSI